MTEPRIQPDHLAGESDNGIVIPRPPSPPAPASTDRIDLTDFPPPSGPPSAPQLVEDDVPDGDAPDGDGSDRGVSDGGIAPGDDGHTPDNGSVDGPVEAAAAAPPHRPTTGADRPWFATSGPGGTSGVPWRPTAPKLLDDPPRRARSARRPGAARSPGAITRVTPEDAPSATPAEEGPTASVRPGLGADAFIAAWPGGPDLPAQSGEPTHPDDENSAPSPPPADHHEPEPLTSNHEALTDHEPFTDTHEPDPDDDPEPLTDAYEPDPDDDPEPLTDAYEPESFADEPERLTDDHEPGPHAADDHDPPQGAEPEAEEPSVESAAALGLDDEWSPDEEPHPDDAPLDGSAPVDDDEPDPPAQLDDREPAPVSDTEARSRDGLLIPRATEPEIGPLELRQTAGLNAGSAMLLEPQRYDFSEDGDLVGFRLDVSADDQVVLEPIEASVKIDSVPVTAPTVVGDGAIDVGSARFIVRHRRIRHRPTDWLVEHEAIERAEPEIVVPADLAEPPAASKRVFGRRRSRADAEARRQQAAEEFMQQVATVRRERAERERHVHPDPAELADQAVQRAPVLGVRPPGHPLFARVGVVVADMPWIPRFDDIAAVPDDVGAELQPLMSLPSLPVPADLMIGPLGIVGDRGAVLACARHVMVSLYGLSTAAMRLHVVAPDADAGIWEWADPILAWGNPTPGDGFPIVVADGAAEFARSGLEHRDVADRQAGLVVLDSEVDALPSYCGTVLQVDRHGEALLTNHHGHLISGTPMGIADGFAGRVARDLAALMARRHRR